MITPAFGLTATERVLPKLALDFTTAALDSRITFTRTTSASNPATYIGNDGYVTSATNDQPRFDYDPVTLVCKGLLIEESRTNQCIYGNNLASGSGWTFSAVTPTANQLTAPNNQTEAALLNEGATSAQHYFYNGASSFTSGVNYTASVYVKAGTVQWIQIPLSSTGFGANAWANFDIVNGAVGNKGSATTASIKNAGNGWWRCIVTAPATATVSTTSIQIAFCGNTNTASRLPSTVGTSKTFYAWGAQLEAGAFATSYIPTTTAALTRNADVATMTGTNFSDWFNASEGAAVVQVLPSTTNGTRPAIEFDNNTANQAITLRGAAADPQLFVVNGGAAQATLDAGTITANAAYKLGGAWKSANFAAAVNGGASVSQLSGTYPTVTQARLGSDGTNYLNGCLQNLRYWPQRITNAETQSFSK